MHPTVDQQLRGARRLIDGVAARQDLPPGVTAALADARMILRRVESSWSAVLPFLAGDSRATVALLAEVTTVVPEVATLVPEAVVTADAERVRRPTEPVLVADGASSAGVADTELDVTLADARNRALRAVLADVVRALPAAGAAGDHPAAASARALIAAHLRARLDRDPTNRRAAP